MPSSASDAASIDTTKTSSSLCPSSSFSERRRRAAKLTQFFGVSYQDISQSIAGKMLPPLSNQKSFAANVTINPPVPVEVNVKIAGRRFWGLLDREMKNADVIDVIDELRELRAA
ncbi:hypothetical protein C0991_000052 [Blastosporella zonata]|nr:hypothetical protein C0991_000052 [Blastosporella zonata]